MAGQLEYKLQNFYAKAAMDNLLDFVEFAGRGNLHNFSIENLLTIYAKKHDATICVSFDQWKRSGRYPRRGTGIEIFPYNTKQIDEKKTTYVFDVSDTEGKELSLPPEIENRVVNSYMIDNESAYLKKIFQDVQESLSDKMQFINEEENTKQWKDQLILFMAYSACFMFLSRHKYSQLAERTLSSGRLQEKIEQGMHLFYNENEFRTDMFLSCMEAVRQAAHAQILSLIEFDKGVQERRRLRENERENSADGRGEASSDDRRGGISGTGSSNESAFRGSGGDTGSTGAASEESNGIPGRELQGADPTSISGWETGEDPDREDRGSEEVLRGESPEDAGEREDLRNQGYNAEDTEGESDRGESSGDDRSGDSFPPVISVSSIEETEPTDESGQLSIFSFLSEDRDEGMSTREIPVYDTPFNPPSLCNDEEINQILRTGACGYNFGSISRIFSYYSTRWDAIDHEGAAEYIKKQFGSACLGFTIGNRKISVSYHDDGMHLSRHEESRRQPEMVVSWEDIERHIYNMISENRFIDLAGEAVSASIDEEELANELVYYFTDGFYLEERQELIPEVFKQKRVFPEFRDGVKEALKDPERANEILTAARVLWAMYREGSIERKWRYACDLYRVQHLEAYLNGRHQFDFTEKLDEVSASFIPIEAFDNQIYSQKDTEQEKQRRFYIMDASESGNNVDGLVKYLKNRLGDGGSSYSGFTFDHWKSKPCKLAISSVDTKNYDKDMVREEPLKALSKRICRIIKAEGILISDEEKEEYKGWKKDYDAERQAERLFREELEREKEKLSEQYGMNLPYDRYITNTEKAEVLRKAIQMFIENPRLSQVRHTMANVLASDDIEMKDKASFVHSIIVLNKGKVFPLVGYDYITVMSGRYHIEYGKETEYSSEYLSVNCFPGNYINTKSWIGGYNHAQISVEEITDMLTDYFKEHPVKEEAMTDGDYGIYADLFHEYIGKLGGKEELKSSLEQALKDHAEIEVVFSTPEEGIIQNARESLFVNQRIVYSEEQDGYLWIADKKNGYSDSDKGIVLFTLGAYRDGLTDYVMSIIERDGGQIGEITQIKTEENMDNTREENIGDTLPYIHCIWSESSAFEENKNYTVKEFQEIMQREDSKHIQIKKDMIEKYGSWQEWYDSDENSEYLGYYKVKFSVHTKDGKTFVERQDIGDGDGGVLEFLSEYPTYEKYLPELMEAAGVERIRVNHQEKETIEQPVTAETVSGTSEIKDITGETASDSLPLSEENKPERNLRSFHYDDIWVPNTGNAQARFEKNLEAIRILKNIEMNGGEPTNAERMTLSQYVGWGGLSMYFDETRSQYEAERNELKELLTEEEYKSARASCTDSFYTPKEVINGVYEGLERLGFAGGRILEPSMGIGNFFNGMPKDMIRQSDLYGVELDQISGNIAKLLHPDANIQISGIERADLKEESFDLVIGNVPFGEYKVNDPDFRNENFMIHDYFFAKALKECRPGGIVCLITSKGTLDKKNSAVREYIAKWADFLGAIRLPNTVFADSANTEVTSDVIFLQKKAVPTIEAQEFTTVETVGDEYAKGYPLNSYYVSYPFMMLGHMEVDTQRYGEERALTYLAPDPDFDLVKNMESALRYLPEGVYKKDERIEEKVEEEVVESIPAEAGVKNYTFCVRNDKIYMREGNVMIQQKQISEKQADRVKKLCPLREVLHEVIDAQLNGCSDGELSVLQHQLNTIYDDYVELYGRINDKETKRIFGDDVEYTLLCALEDIVNGKIVKAGIFTERTIHPKVVHESVSTALEAMNITVAEKGYVDMDMVLSLYKHPLSEVVSELKGEIFLSPGSEGKSIEESRYLTKEEYLSGDVRAKLSEANIAALTDKRFQENIAALTEVIPKDLDATEIDVKIGANWIDAKDYELFMFEKFGVPFYMRRTIFMEYNSIINSYYIHDKHRLSSVENRSTYGTTRMSAVEIFETLLNMRQVQVKDRFEEPGGKVTYVLNEKATVLAKAQAEKMKEDFKTWLFEDKDRREKYVKIYNERFNNIKVREYDGSFMEFPGMNPTEALRPYQKDAVARIIRGGNTLLGHCVGAGKSREMAAAAMELKRLGLANKTMIVVPNHLTGQMANEFLRIYPSANILLTRKEDFEKSKRKRFISKIATGNYDAIIIGHSQFEKIPISKERQKEYIESQIEEVEAFIAKMKNESSQRWSVKQMEAFRRNLAVQLQKLANEDYKDDVINFEELGVDCLMVDEAHNFKNLSFNTKIGNVAGINPTGSLKAYDLSLKAQYINELHPGRNVVFATGTPISNTMCEMYIMQKYLQPDLLKAKGLYHFDAWAANFGEVVTSMELSPEGKGYRQKTRFAKFTNLPELVTSFRMVADIKTQDMLPFLDIPELNGGKYDIVECEASDEVKDCIDEFVERAGRVRSGSVDSREDNMLKICHDAKLVSTDIRMYRPDSEPDVDGKLYKCVENVYRIWKETADTKAAQVIFSDLGVPSADKDKFSVYQFIKDELVKKGVPADEVRFIHDAKTDKQRSDLFSDVRNGLCRVIIGSTEKMGTGTNIQERLYAMHEIDVPWRPSDVEQREGRILRFGNMFDQVHIYRYVTKGTFDAYNWSIIENKQKFISQVMTNGDVARTCADIDEAVLNYAEMKAVASGNPLIKEKMEVDTEVTRLTLLKRSFTSNRWDMEKQLQEILPAKKEKETEYIRQIEADIEKRNATPLYGRKSDDQVSIQINNGSSEENTAEEKKEDETPFVMKIHGIEVDDRKKAGTLIHDLLKKIPMDGKIIEFGEYAGFHLGLLHDSNSITLENEYRIIVKGEMQYSCSANTTTEIGNVYRIENLVHGFDKELAKHKEKLDEVEAAIVSTAKEYNKAFPQEETLQKLLGRQAELTELLSEDAKEKDQEEEREETTDKKNEEGKTMAHSQFPSRAAV